MKRSQFVPSISEARAIEILDAYGADPRKWPEPERAPLETLLATSPALQAIRQRAADLDASLDQWQPETRFDTDALLAALPTRADHNDHWMARFLDRLFEPAFGWQQITAAIVPLTIGLAWGLSTTAPPDDWSEVELSLLNLPVEVLSDD